MIGHLFLNHTFWRAIECQVFFKFCKRMDRINYWLEFHYLGKKELGHIVFGCDGIEQ